MKKVFIVLIVLGALTYLYFSDFDSAEIVKSPETSTTESTNINPDPSNATFIFNDGPVTLSKGKAEKSSGDSELLKEEIELSNLIAYGELNNDNKKDAAVVLSRSGGVSGFFIYLAPFLSGSGSYKGGNAIYIGDRIIPQEITINGNVVKLTYLDRSEEEPLAADPTISRTKEFVVINGILEER